MTKLDIFLKKVLWAIVAVYGVAMALCLFSFLSSFRDNSFRDTAEWEVLEPHDFTILFIRDDGLQYGDNDITEEELVDLIESRIGSILYYIAEPSAYADRIIAVLQKSTDDHGIYLCNFTEAHEQNFIMENLR